MSAASELDTHRLLKQAYLEIKKLRGAINEAAEEAYEPVAVVGMGCRYPAGVVNAESLWDTLRGGVDAVREVPAERYDVDSHYDPDPDAPGKLYIREGAFLEGVDLFDAAFFGISPLEAASMDPQQRLLLEVAWEALEDAAISPTSLRGSQVGVFVGLMHQEYLTLSLRRLGIDGIGPYLGTGATASAAAGRLSYVLGLQGPSLTVDTACSSSLVSVHLACQSLRNQESDLALAGGVNVLLLPDGTVNLSKARMMSPSGRCRTFDADADGYVRGEGCGIVALKRLSQARQDGDRILGLIRGSAVNQDGRSNGFTAPNGLSQRQLLQDALKAARAKPEEIGYVECHGTGTALGDPIELGAIMEVLGSRLQNKPLAIGSIKTNFGHLESAAGIAGLMKALLVLRHKEIPPHLHLKSLNPLIKLDGRPVLIPTKSTPWFQQGQTMAAVSAFGFVGTNAHVILQAWEDLPRQEATAPTGAKARSVEVLTLSAASEQALAALTERYADKLAKSDVNLADLCHTAQTGRTHLAHRLAIVGNNSALMAAALRQPNLESNGVFKGSLELERPAQPVFLFTGQGSQYPGMGRGLYESEPVFRAALDRCAELLDGQLDKPLLDVMFAEPGSEDAQWLDETAYTQPALFALGYALFEQWTAWGVIPSALLGASVGEYTAACVAGVFSLSDALRLIAARGRLMQSLPEGGGMAAVIAPYAEAWVSEAVAPFAESLSVAAVNASTEVVVSGALADLRQLLDRAEREGIHAKLLKVSHAFHSPLMRPILETYRQELQTVEFHRPRWPIMSNLTGTMADERIASPDYWLEHIMATVQFQRSLDTVKRGGHRVLLELGPRPVLTALARREFNEANVGVATLRSPQDDGELMRKALANLYVQGVAIDWNAVSKPYPPRKVALPTYPFQRKRYWLNTGDEARKPTASDWRSASTENWSGWLYTPQWRELAWAEDDGQAVFDKPWLVFEDRLGVGRAWGGQTAPLHHEFIRWGRADEKPETNGRYLNIEQADGFTRLLSQLDLSIYAGLLYTWPLDAQTAETVDADGLVEAQSLGIEACTALVQAVLASGCPQPPKLWIATRGAQAVGSSDRLSGLSQAALWGLAGSMAREAPELWGGIIDLDPNASVQSAAADLNRLLAQNPGETLLAVRAGRRYIKRLVRGGDSMGGVSSLSFRDDAAYMIAGGLGGLSVSTAAWMARHGAGQIILVGRSSMPSSEAETTLEKDDPRRESLATLRAMRQLGVGLEYVVLDIADEQQARAYLERRSQQPDALPIAGFIHAAGVYHDEALRRVSRDLIRDVQRAKLQGAWTMHRLLPTKLDFFVLFSSFSALTPLPGQAAYAGACAFMDALAHFRAAQGLTAMSINWSVWSDVGYVQSKAGRAAQSRLKTLGLQSIEPKQGFAVLEQLLVDPTRLTQVGVFPMDLQAVARTDTVLADSPLLAELCGKKERPASGLTSVERFQEALLGKNLNAQREYLIDTLSQIVANVLQLPPGKVNSAQPLVQQGLDSLIALHLKNHVYKSTGFEFSVVNALSGGSVASLAEELMTEWRLRALRTEQDTESVDEEAELHEEIEL